MADFLKHLIHQFELPLGNPVLIFSLILFIILLLENLPSKLEKHFPSNSRLVIYPQQFNQNYGSEGYKDITAEPLNKGIETIQKISKGITDIRVNFYMRKNMHLISLSVILLKLFKTPL